MPDSKRIIPSAIVGRSTEEIRPVELAGGLGQESPGPRIDPVITRLKKFQAIRGRVLNFSVLVLPYAALLLLLAAFLVGADPMFLTGVLAAATAAFLFKALLRQIPVVLERLWKRQALAVPDHSIASNEPLLESLINRLPSWLGAPDPNQTASLPADVTARYLYFIKRFENALNHRFAWVFGAVITGILYVSFSIRIYPTSDGWWNHLIDWPVLLVQGGDWLYLAGVVVQLVLAFALGLLLWRMAVAAHKVYQMGNIFDLKVQVTHPDNCGGLRPLGDLCLTNALILTAPAIFLAAWLTVIPAYGPFSHHYSSYINYYYYLLWIVVVLALVAFVQPLYGVHLAMVRERARLQTPLDEVDQRIALTTQRLLDEAGTANTEQLDDLRKQLAALREIYELNSDVPVWPFDRKVLGRFSLSQFIPLLGLTGIAPAIVTTLEKVFPS
jgi:hypothetical protein